MRCRAICIFRVAIDNCAGPLAMGYHILSGNTCPSGLVAVSAHEANFPHSCLSRVWPHTLLYTYISVVWFLRYVNDDRSLNFLASTANKLSCCRNIYVSTTYLSILRFLDSEIQSSEFNSQGQATRVPCSAIWNGFICPGGWTPALFLPKIIGIRHPGMGAW